MKKVFRVFEPDEDAVYEETIRVDLSQVELTVSFPHLPENARPVREAKDIVVDQVVIGSCTNGRMEDMEVTATLLKGKKVAPGVRLIIIPGTQQVYLNCIENGWAQIFVEAGAVFSTPTCGPCLGGHTGVLAAGEVALSTTNRNFVGRMGHPESQVYLASPAVAAATAITGKIASPFDLPAAPSIG
jgi:3-isopropylmalate/(R)-2-methylmalate dehydratase large subunit